MCCAIHNFKSSHETLQGTSWHPISQPMKRHASYASCPGYVDELTYCFDFQLKHAEVVEEADGHPDGWVKKHKDIVLLIHCFLFVFIPVSFHILSVQMFCFSTCYKSECVCEADFVDKIVKPLWWFGCLTVSRTNMYISWLRMLC